MTANATAAVEFDFENKRERSIEPTQAKAACDAGMFCWIDIDAAADVELAEAILKEMGVNEHAIREAIGPDVDGRYDLYDDCLHFAVTSGSLQDRKLNTSHVDVVVGERFLMTIHRGRVDAIDQVRRHYRQDFHRYAKTPSFLVYEFWDALVESYKRTIRGLASQVELFQDQIFGDVSDAIFDNVSAVTRDLLSFRKIMLAAREVLHELASRRSPYVSEATQPFLEKMGDTLERLGADLTVERDILSETLNLYMSITSHRTNKIVSRLTVISVVFLPLTFLCGVYGMNFEVLPELKWQYSYMVFWAVVIAIAAGLLIYMKKRKWW
jgi:magnesium transporter